MDSRDSIGALLDRVSTKARRIATASPLSTDAVSRFRAEYALHYAHETTALDGSSLTLEESRSVLEQGLTVNNKPLAEHLALVNAFCAWRWLEKVIPRDEPATEDLLLHLHGMLMQGLLPDDAGAYRTRAASALGTHYQPAPVAKISSRVRALLSRLRTSTSDRHPVEEATRALAEFVAMRPFVEGNGRTGRLLVNLILMRDGYPPALYSARRRDTYQAAWAAAHQEGSLDLLYIETAHAVDTMLDQHLRLLDRQAGRDHAAP